MRRAFTSIRFWCAACALVVGTSVVADSGRDSWVWFQRSGSFVVLAGAALTYRSIVRMGVRGVGGANTTIVMGTLAATDDTGPVPRATLRFDEETSTYLTEADKDKFAGFVGARLLVVGTLVWGYGDLLGRIG